MKNRLRLVGHFLEALLAMLAGRLVLGAVLHMATGGFLDSHPGIDAFAMAAVMAVGVADWMRFRGYDAAAVGELIGAAFAPAVLLIGPYLLGLFSGDALLAAMYVLMAVFVAAAMLRRRDDYAAAAPRPLHWPGRRPRPTPGPAV
jgi:hypothetical protein